MELKKLRAELENRSSTPGSTVDKNMLNEMNKEKKRLEEDRQNAINLLENREKEFAMEKVEKERLMARIKMLTS
jgi:hypothetical protein